MPNSQKNTKYTNKDGLEELIVKSKKMPTKINDIAKAFDLKLNYFNPLYTTKILSKEQSTLDNIIKAFKNEKHILQHKVGKYKIDLYFIDNKLAIECDEHGHNDRNPEYEQQRENFITNKLNCKFVRYNPDDLNFDIFNVINQIYTTLKS